MTINEEDRSADVLRRQADGSGRRLAALAAAVVTCDDAKTDVKALVSATTKAGNPSTPKA
jgi:hypothetical protein